MLIMHSNKLLFLWIPADINIVLLFLTPLCNRSSGIYILTGLSETTSPVWFIFHWVFFCSCVSLLKLIGVAGFTSLPRVWTAFENVIHISLARRTKRFTLLLWEIDHLFPPISFVHGNNVLYFSSLVESVWGSKNLAGQKQTIHQLSERLNYHWVDWIKPLGRDSLGLLQRGVS